MGFADLQDAALACLRASEPGAKLALSHEVAAAWRAGALPLSAGGEAEALVAPGRPARPRLVHPSRLPRRGLGTPAGRVALLHAVAHIEFNAINLAWDAVYRFRDLPRGFYDDWVAVAEDESRHFAMLSRRLAELGHGYGDFDAHDGLWQMAVKTADSRLARMALVPRVLEARGLDVSPGMIDRLREAGDEASAAIIATILDEEVAHVAAGTRWFHWCCEREGREPEACFEALLAEHGGPALRGPFNHPARRRAGFSESELAALERRAGGGA